MAAVPSPKKVTCETQLRRLELTRTIVPVLHTGAGAGPLRFGQADVAEIRPE